MSKWGKTLLGLAAVGGAVAAGALYYTKKNKCTEDEAFEDVFEDDDFDLDSDLKPVTDREYVPLTPSANEEAAEEAVAEETVVEETVVEEEAAVEEAEESTEE